MERPEVKILIYKFTGKLGFIKIPEKVCRECDLTVESVKHITRELAPYYNIRIQVKGWWSNIFKALRTGCWHAPCVLINGRVASQGKVPSRESIVQAIESL